MDVATSHPTGEPSDHVVQFYASDADLLAVAGERLHAALMDGGVGVVVATPDHLRGFESQLRHLGVDVDAASAEGRLVTLDAEATLGRFTRDGEFVRDSFKDVIAPVLRRAAATGRPVWVFGEMVALLWAAGHVVSAIELEAAWDKLAAELGCAVYCAYPKASVTGDEHAPALERVCALHSALVGATVPDTTWQFGADVVSASRVRHLLTELLQRHGHDGALLDDARIVAAELAANAVVHAGSPFTVRTRSRGPFVRIEVSDRSSRLPAVQEPDPVTSTGRGLRLVAALARRWGVEASPEGKTVWAELAA